MDQQRRGLVYAIAGYVLWGVLPAFWKLLEDVSPAQQLAHRVLWAFPLLLVAIVGLRRLPAFKANLRSGRTLLLMAASAGVLAVNWGVYLWAIANDQIVAASLGYFINPLLSVALGVVVLGERLRPAQTAAVGLAAAGVAYMAVRLGEPPWVALVLAATFAVYGLLKKRPEAARPLEGLLGETALLSGPALAFLLVTGLRGGGSFGSDAGTTLLLVATGAVTVAPLLFFAGGAQRIPLSTVGILQYMTPTMQFLLGVLAYGETVGTDEMVGFALVWIALAVYSTDNVRRARRTQAERRAVPSR